MSCLQTLQASCGQDRCLVEGSESCKPNLRIFAGTCVKMCFSPHGSVWNFEGWVLLRISLGLAERSFWSDLEKLPKSASGEILEGPGQHFGLGTSLCQKKWSGKRWFCGGMILWWSFRGIHPAQMNSMVPGTHMGRLLCPQNR